MCVLIFLCFCSVGFWWHCKMTDLGRTCLILEYQNNMFLQQAMIMKLLYYDHLLYTRWYGQEVYNYKKKNNNNSTWFVFFFGFKKKKNTGFIQTPCSRFFPTLCCWTFCYNVSLQKTYWSQKTAWSTEDCMSFAFQSVDQLWYSCIILKKKPLLSSAPRLPVRPCSEVVVKRVLCWIS